MNNGKVDDLLRVAPDLFLSGNRYASSEGAYSDAEDHYRPSETTSRRLKWSNRKFKEFPRFLSSSGGVTLDGGLKASYFISRDSEDVLFLPLGLCLLLICSSILRARHEER